jgi:hypothetical protein
MQRRPVENDHLEPLAVSVWEASRLTGLGVTKIWELISEGKIEVARIDRRTLALVASLKQLLTPKHDEAAARDRSAAARRLRAKRTRREQVRAEAP